MSARRDPREVPRIGSDVAVRLHYDGVVTDTPAAERRVPGRHDRRRHSRSGRRHGDPHNNWRHVAWLFAGYAGYLVIRFFPRAFRRLFRRPGR
jgi:hypothetical protein